MGIIFHDGAFKNLSQVRKLTIYGCGLSTPPNIKWICSTLENMDLTNNNLTTLPLEYFDGCKKMRYLHLEDNSLITMPYLYDLRETLAFISLANNDIKRCHYLCEGYFTKLETIIMDGNRLKEFQFSLGKPDLGF